MIAPNAGTLTHTTAGVYKVFLLPSYRQRAMPRRHGVNFFGTPKARSSRRRPLAHRCVTIVVSCRHCINFRTNSETTIVPPTLAPTVRFTYHNYNRKGRTSAYARTSSLLSDWIVCRSCLPSPLACGRPHPRCYPIG